MCFVLQINALSLIDCEYPDRRSWGCFIYATSLQALCTQAPPAMAFYPSAADSLSRAPPRHWIFFTLRPSRHAGALPKIQLRFLALKRNPLLWTSLPQSCVLISSSRMRGCQYDNRRERKPFLPPYPFVSTRPIFTQNQPWSDSN